MNAAVEFTDQQLIEKYLWMRQLVEVKKKAYNDLVKPYLAGMEVIEKAIMARLIQRDSQNTKTDAGTAFRVTHMKVGIRDRDAFLEYVRTAEGGDAMLLVQPQKDAVRDYIDKFNEPPPGVDVNYFPAINVRKA